jgi:transcriptional regulator with XRE-family HTH domain
MSQTEAAAKLGIGKAALSAWEVGRNIPDALMLGRVSRTYGVSADSLLWGGDFAQDRKIVEAVRAALGPMNLTRTTDERERPDSGLRLTAEQKQRRRIARQNRQLAPRKAE